jgi:hypothetical protein
MAGTADDNGGGQQLQQMTMVADNSSTQDWVADYEGEGQEQAANNDRINVGMRLNMKPAV